MSIMNLAVRSLFFDDDGRGERMDTRVSAELREEKEGLFLSYSDPENGLPQTDIFIKKGTPCVVKMQQPQTDILFSVGRTHKTLYRIEGVGEFDFTVTAHRVESSVTEALGGEIKLDYEAILGGARRRTVMTLTLTKPQEEDKA